MRCAALRRQYGKGSRGRRGIIDGHGLRNGTLPATAEARQRHVEIAESAVSMRRVNLITRRAVTEIPEVRVRSFGNVIESHRRIILRSRETDGRAFDHGNVIGLGFRTLSEGIENRQINVVNARHIVSDFRIGDRGSTRISAGERPLITVGIARRSARKIDGKRGAAARLVGGKVSRRRGVVLNNDGLRSAFLSAVARCRQGDDVGAGGGVSVGRVGLRTRIAVAETPVKTVRPARIIRKVYRVAVDIVSKRHVGIAGADSDVICLRLRVRTRRIGRRQSNGINAGRVVGHGRVFNGSGRTREVPRQARFTGTRIGKIDYQRRTTAGRITEEIGCRRSAAAAATAATARAAGSQATDGVEVAVDGINGIRRPRVGIVYGRCHDVRRAGSIVRAVEIVTGLVRNQDAQRPSRARKILQTLVAEIRTNRTDVSDTDGRAVKVTVRPQLTQIVGIAETARPPRAETAQESTRIVARRPRVSAAVGNDILLDNIELNFIRKGIVVVGRHVVHHADRVIFYARYAAEFLKHRKVGSNRQLYGVAFTVHHFRSVFFFRADLRLVFFLLRVEFYRRTFVAVVLDDVGGFVNDKGIVCCIRNEVAQRLDVKSLRALLDKTVQKIFGYGQSRQVGLHTVYVTLCGYGGECF